MELDAAKKFFEEQAEKLKERQEELKKKEKELVEFFSPRLIKNIIVDGKQAKITLTKSGKNIIEFVDETEAEKFYNSLK